MKRCLMPAALAVAATLATTPAWSDDAGVDPARNEISVFGGISIQSASRTDQTTVMVPSIRWLPGWPGDGSDSVQVSTETELGNGALIGVRYSFYLRKQLALEADAVVAPSHELRGSLGVCSSSECYGGRDHAGAMRGGEFHMEGSRGFGRRDVTAWHYGLGLTYDILGGDVRPYVTAGTGGVTYDGTSDTETDFVLRLGAGVKVYFGRIGARVDAVDHLVFDHFLTGGNEHDVHLTGGAFVRF